MAIKLIVFLVVIGGGYGILAYALHLKRINEKAMEREICRMALIEDRLLTLLHSSAKYEHFFKNNKRFAIAKYSNRMKTESVSYYYEIMDACDATVIIGVFEYIVKGNCYYVFLGIDFFSRQIVILESGRYLYKSQFVTHKHNLQFTDLINYVLTLKWRCSQWEILKREPPKMLYWKPSIGYPISKIPIMGSSLRSGLL